MLFICLSFSLHFQVNGEAETQSCYSPCDANCGFEYTSTDCTVTCGVGTYTRTFNVLTEATGSGTCENEDGFEEEVECVSPCPVEGCMDGNVHTK